MRRRLSALVICSIVAVAACGGREQSATARTKNGFLNFAPVLVNGNFDVKGGGWEGVGFKLGKGCQDSQVNQPNLPSYTWDKNRITFGSEQKSVVQTVKVPIPTMVTFSVETFAMHEGNQIAVELRDDNETRTETNIGVVSVSVITTRPQELVTITLTGKPAPNLRGWCAGAAFRNASLVAKAAPTTTTSTSTTSSTTTTVLTTTVSSTTTTTIRPTTTTTSTTTSTTVAPTTTLPPAPACSSDGRCAVGNSGPGTGLVYLVDSNQPATYNRYFELAPRGWKGGNVTDPSLTVDAALRAVAEGITTRTGKVIPAPWNGESELDWRVPTKPELQDVYDSKVDPSMKGEYLSITRGSLQDMIYEYLNFDTGRWRSAPAADTAKVRPVRRGPSPCALGGPCKIGDVGPMGGKVFYATTKLSPIVTGNQRCTADSWNPCLYMEMAPDGWNGTTSDPIAMWANPSGCCKPVPGPGAVGTGIGSGDINTNAIMLQQQSFMSAARIANEGDPAKNQRSVWYLPSTEEIREIYKNRASVGGPKTGTYWTSTEKGQNVAIAFNFDTGTMDESLYKDGYGGQHGGQRVRPVRPFAPACVPGIASVPRTANDLAKRLTTDPCLTLRN